VYTSDTVAWVPLAPGEIYYGIGFYGPFSVDITNVVVNPVVVRQYRHIHVRNAVTIIDRSTFVKGRRGRPVTRENPFTSRRAEVGPPSIRPGRETRRPIDRRIPPERQPPERIRKLKLEDMRRERRVVPGEAGSVFSPGRPAEEMRVKRRETPRRPEVKPAPSGGRRSEGGTGPSSVVNGQKRGKRGALPPPRYPRPSRGRRHPDNRAGKMHIARPR
jgi:hypothetical protein